MIWLPFKNRVNLTRDDRPKDPHRHCLFDLKRAHQDWAVLKRVHRRLLDLERDQQVIGQCWRSMGL